MKSLRHDPATFIGRLFPQGVQVDRSLPLSTQIHALLRESIITMTLVPNEKIFERLIAEELAISRTPVREALQMLAREELVLIAPQSGTYVAPVRHEQFVESALIREVLETASIRRAADVITGRDLLALRDIHTAHCRAVEFRDSVAAIGHDNAFHARVSAAAHLPKVSALVEWARVPIDRVRHVTVRNPVVATVTLDQHRAILEALERRDPDAAETALRHHLDDAFRRQEQAFQANREMFEGRGESHVPRLAS